MVGHLLDDAAPPVATSVAAPRSGPREPAPCPAQHVSHRRHAAEVDIVGVGAEVDVVTEQQRRFVAEDGAADVRQDADVVQRGEVLLRQPETLAQPHAEPRRPQHVLRRLAQAEVCRQ
ncbi:MAG: hypothetical protein WKF71_00480 [Pyrinomonadaceae bacterium]